MHQFTANYVKPLPAATSLKPFTNPMVTDEVVHPMSRNRLDSETSPYLLQHRDNPVHWQPWDDETLAAAKRDNKPILLSIGYSACHWCHVMAHESFEDPDIAALMNELFVNIKVDREERPDLDAIYQSSLALLGQHGGWPLTMFLTSAAEPFWGGTYFPPTGKYGRPGFTDVLRTVHAVYTREPEKVDQNRKALAEALAALSRGKTGGAVPPPAVEQAAQQLLAAIDPVDGGIGGPPKFPQVPALEFLWRAYCRGGDTRFRDAVVLSARRMCEGGIYDHLGGGFARYATDGRWLVPHFEKMLYDNALLIDLLAQLWADGGDPLFAQRVAETVGWARREMVAPGGGFTSALDADSEGEEGLFYTWSAAEIDDLLGADAAFFKAAYDVTPEGNWEGRNILNRISPRGAGAAGAASAGGEDGQRLASLRDILLRARAHRVRPYHDDKVLADWNGLMISAFATAGAVFDRPEWVDAAAAAYAFVHDHMSDGDRLAHSFRDGRYKAGAFLDDYANMSHAALTLYEVTADPAYLAQAKAWVAAADRFYWDGDGGGYFFTAADGEQLIVRTKTAADTATPAGNGMMVSVLARLYAMTANATYRERAEAVAAAFAHQLAQTPVASCTLLNGLETLGAAVQVVLVGDPRAEAAQRLRRAVFAVAAPNRVLIRLTPGTDLPPGHPAAGKTEIDGKPTAYVCVGTTCSLPITDADDLRAALARR